MRLEPGRAHKFVWRLVVVERQLELLVIEQLFVELRLLIEQQQFVLEQQFEQFVVEQLELVQLQRLLVEQRVLEQFLLERLRILELLEQQRRLEDRRRCREAAHGERLARVKRRRAKRARSGTRPPTVCA